jgi:hypothetical protein
MWPVFRYETHEQKARWHADLPWTLWREEQQMYVLAIFQGKYNYGMTRP